MDGTNHCRLSWYAMRYFACELGWKGNCYCGIYPVAEWVLWSCLEYFRL